jgi:hypothetical protein
MFTGLRRLNYTCISASLAMSQLGDNLCTRSIHVSWHNVVNSSALVDSCSPRGRLSYAERTTDSQVPSELQCTCNSFACRLVPSRRVMVRPKRRAYARSSGRAWLRSVLWGGTTKLLGFSLACGGRRRCSYSKYKAKRTGHGHAHSHHGAKPAPGPRTKWLDKSMICKIMFSSRRNPATEQLGSTASISSRPASFFRNGNRSPNLCIKMMIWLFFY